MTIGTIIGEPLEVHDGLKGNKKNVRVEELLESRWDQPRFGKPLPP